MDPRGPETVGADGDHEGYGRESKSDGELQAGGSEREGLRGGIREGVSDEGYFYSLGDPTVITMVPWEGSGFGNDV